VFGRTKTTAGPEEATLHPPREGAKNRPTPKRREQEAARKQPLVVTDRKRAKELDRQKRRAQLAKQRQAMLTGDESGLPARDRGPVRRYIRDHVDARWNLGEFMLPVMVLVLALSFVPRAWAMLLVFVVVYGLIIFAVLDAVLTWRRLKKHLVARFGADAIPSGSAMYAVMRVFQMRRLRMPRPQVARGQYPS
jgi:Flp pilus assembly protein TadB